MIEREMAGELLALTREYPVVTLLGPRQAGKTTLARETLKAYDYSNLEIPEVRVLAEHDPKAYLKGLGKNVIIDEIQRVPALLSYIQGIVDTEHRNGQFIITGSHQLRLREAVGQSLAGRTALLHLLPLSIGELAGAGIRQASFEDYAFRGFLPRIYAEKLRPTPAYSNYYQTYVERDVRLLINLKDASLFEKLLKLLAGRVGQLIDYGSLGNDVGVAPKTVRNWLSILEASFVVFKLPPYFENFGKRVIKAPKYYFTDVGLLCYLLGIRKPQHITRDPLVGGIFENLVILECLKQRYNHGHMADLYFYRDSHGNEVDLLVPDGRSLRAVEIKAAATFSPKQLKGLERLGKIAPNVSANYLIYNGDNITLSNGIRVLNFTHATQLAAR